MRKYSLGVFFNVWTSNKEDWKSQAKFIQQLKGVEHVEIMLENVDLTKEEISYIQELLPYKKIVHAPFMNLSLLSPHEEIRKASRAVYKKAFHIARIFDADTITLHLDSYPNYYTESYVQKNIYQEIDELIQNSNFKIGIENMSYTSTAKNSYPSQPEHMYSLAVSLPKDVGFTLDVGHFLLDEVNPIQLLSKLKNRIFDIHLHDGKKGKAHLALGKGDLKLESFLKCLEEIDYRGYVTLEVMGKEEIKTSWNILQQKLQT